MEKIMRLFGSFAILVFVSFLQINSVSAAEYAQASKVGKANIASLGCKKGEIWDPINGGECWTCSGKQRTIFAVTSNKACEKPAGESLKKASLKSKNAFSCAKGTFFDPRKGGECWSCPSGYSRTLAAVTAGDACVLPP
jgi:hypothetical protein